MTRIDLAPAHHVPWSERAAHPQHVALVNMPFAVTDRPSIQCATLKAVLAAAGHEVQVFYFNLYLAARLGGRAYHQLAAPRRQGLLLGEWLFSVAAFGDDAPDADAYRAACPEVDDACRELGLTFADLRRLREETLPSQVDAWAASCDWARYAVVGFTSTFEQHTAALALSRRIKARAAETCIVFGGANLDGEMGPAHVRAWDWIDAAVVGEGEEALCAIVDHVACGAALHGIAGVVTRDGTYGHGTRAPSLTDLDTLPDPDYDDYFAALFALGVDRVMTAELPLLLFETARGCWWGQKHHCTFCGLNADGMAFRSKSPDRVLGELRRLARKYHLLQFEAVDNIMDPRYLARVWRPLAEEHVDYSLFYEVKANLSRDQLRTLAAAGVRAIQPGIESLSTRLLKLMRKGTTLLENLRALKWAPYYGIRVGWNLLCGFPGERAEDYEAQTRLIPLVCHLPPPAGTGPIWMERFSPYFADPSFPVRRMEPEAAYPFVYPPHRVDVERIAYFFSYEMDNVVPYDALGALSDAVARWRAGWESSQRPVLAYQRGPDWMKIVDRRDPARPAAFALSDEEALAYELCGDTARTVPQVLDALEVGGARASSCRADTVNGWLRAACEHGLMVEEDGRYFALAHPVGHW